MVVLRRVEGFCREDFRGDGGLEVRLGGLLARFDDDPLLVVVVEDRAAVLRAHVVALAVGRRGVVHLPEGREEVVQGGFRHVEDEAADLDVAGVAVANLLVGRVDHVATLVATGDAQDAGELLEDRFRTPEAARAEGDGVGVFRDERDGGRRGGRRHKGEVRSQKTECRSVREVG